MQARVRIVALLTLSLIKSHMSATVIVRAGGAISGNPFATVLFSV